MLSPEGQTFSPSGLSLECLLYFKLSGEVWMSSLHAEQISRVKQAAEHKGAEKEHEAAPEATELPAEQVNAAGIVWESFRHSLYFRFQLLDVANVTTIRLYSKEKRIIRF